MVFKLFLNCMHLKRMEGFHFFLIQHIVFTFRSFQLITIYYIKLKFKKKTINQIVTKSINIHHVLERILFILMIKFLNQIS